MMIGDVTVFEPTDREEEIWGEEDEQEDKRVS